MHACRQGAPTQEWQRHFEEAQRSRRRAGALECHRNFGDGPLVFPSVPRQLIEQDERQGQRTLDVAGIAQGVGHALRDVVGQQ
jgi:hypothetical protein